MDGGAKQKTVGSRRQVVNGTAIHTRGGLKVSDMKKNRQGKLVSRAASAAGKSNYHNISSFHALVMKIYKSMPRGADSLKKAMKEAGKQWKARPKK